MTLDDWLKSQPIIIDYRKHLYEWVRCPQCGRRVFRADVLSRGMCNQCTFTRRERKEP